MLRAVVTAVFVFYELFLLGLGIWVVARAVEERARRRRERRWR